MFELGESALYLGLSVLLFLHWKGWIRARPNLEAVRRVTPAGRFFLTVSLYRDFLYQTCDGISL